MDYMPITKKDIEVLVESGFLTGVNLYDEYFEMDNHKVYYDRIEDYDVEIMKNGRKVRFHMKDAVFSPHIKI